MKILFILETFPSFSEVFILNQITYLIKKDHDLTIYSLNKPLNHVDHPEISEHKLIEKTIYRPRIPYSRISKYYSGIKYIFKFIFQTPRTIFKSLNPFVFGRNALNFNILYTIVPLLKSRINYEIIHAHFGEIGLVASNIKKTGLLKGKFICSFHGIDVNRYYFQSKFDFYSSLNQILDAAIVNSLFLKERLCKLGISPNKIYKLSNGVNLDKVKSNENKNNQIFKMISVGRLSVEKGFDVAIQVAKILKDKEKISFKLEIVGSGEKYQELNKLIDSYNLTDCVSIISFLSHDQIMKRFAEADIFILCSRKTKENEEAQGLVIQEAQASGLPVVVSDIGGIKEGLIEGKTGFLCKENDINDFSEKIKRFIQDKELKHRFGIDAKKFVSENFDLQILNNRLVKIYSSII